MLPPAMVPHFSLNPIHMHITINGRPELLDGTTTITLSQLAESHSIPTTGTAIALNGKVVSADKWDVTVLNEGDSLIVISAAYGG